MPTVVRGSDNIDTSNVATQTELDAKSPQMATAWVNFDGTTVDGSNHCTIRDSYNVDYVLRTATGNYDVYFSVAMDNLNYSAVASLGRNGIASYDRNDSVADLALDKVTVQAWFQTGSQVDVDNISLTIFGGKA